MSPSLIRDTDPIDVQLSSSHSSFDQIKATVDVVSLFYLMTCRVTLLGGASPRGLETVQTVAWAQLSVQFKCRFT